MIARATPQLLDLAVAVRQDWDCSELEHAVAALASAGMTWTRILTETVRLMAREDGTPRQLSDQLAAPLHAYEHDPEAYRAGLAAAREAMHRESA